jgi:predicted aspartyl protease
MKSLVRILCWAALLPAVAAGAVRATSPVRQPPATVPTDLRFATPTGHDEVGRIVVPVMIDGKGPFRFLVDTGADGSMVSPALARKLGLSPVVGAAEQVDGTTGSQQLPWVPIATLQVGGIVKRDLRMPICSSPVLGDLDGILGMAGFGEVSVKVDFHHDQVIIGPSNGAELGGFLDIHARRTAGSLLMIPARVGDVRVEAVIDTGAAVTLGNSALHAALLRDAARQATNTKIFGVTRQVSNGGLVAAPTIYLGPAAIRNLAIVYADIPIFKTWHLEKTPAIIIGMNVLGTVDAMVLDYPRARVYLLPPAAKRVSVSVSDMYVRSPLMNGGSD